MTRTSAAFFAALAVALLLGGCAGPQPGVVAKVGKYTITADDLNKAMGPARFKSFEDELEARKRRVESLVEDKLLVLGAYDAGLDKDPEILKQMEGRKKNIRLNALYKLEVEQKVQDIPEQEIKAVYERMKVKLHAKHILVKSKALADSIYAMLQNGADFDSLAKIYSEDRSNKDRGGDLGEFTALTMVAPFEDAAYALKPGELSKPVKTRFGWHIIKLVDRKPNDRVKPYEEEKERITKSLMRRKRVELARKIIEDVFNDAGFKFNDDAVKVVLDAFQKSSQEGGEPSFSPEKLSMELCTWKYGKWTIASLDSAYRTLPPFRKPKITDADGLREFVKNMLQTDLLQKKADELNIEQTDVYKKLYTEQLERLMINAFRKNYLYKGVEPTEEQIRAFYDAHPDSFMDPEKVHVLEIQVATRKEAEDLIAKLKKGADFASLAKKHSLRAYTKDKGGDLGFFSERRYPELFKAAKTIKPGEIYPQPIPFQGKYSVIKLVEVRPPQVKPFESVKRIIKSRLRNKMRQERYKQWVEQAKAKYGVKIYESEIEKTIDKSRYGEAQHARR